MKKLLIVLCIGICLNCSGQTDTTGTTSTVRPKEWPELTGRAVIGKLYRADTANARPLDFDTIRIIMLVCDTVYSRPASLFMVGEKEDKNSTYWHKPPVYWLFGYLARKGYKNYDFWPISDYLDIRKRPLSKQYVVWDAKPTPSK